MNLEERMKHHYSGQAYPGSRNEHVFLRAPRLYKAEGSGRLTIAPAQARVARKTRITLTYHAGERGLLRGNELRIFTVGYNPFSFFTTDPKDKCRALVGIRAPRKTVFDMEVYGSFCRRSITLQLKKGKMKPGATVDIVVGKNNSLGISEIARPVLFHIELKEKDTEKTGKIIGQATLRVRPKKPAAIRCVLPPIVLEGKSSEMALSVLDQYGNLADSAEISPKWSRKKGVTIEKHANLVPGDGGYRIFRNGFTACGPGIHAANGVDRNTGILIKSNPVKCVRRLPRYRLCFGDIHAHDFLSPGLASPMEYYENAVKLGLHFFALPIQTQSNNLTEEKWAIANFMAEEFYRPGIFVAFPAYEWQHYAFGHKNVYYSRADQPYLSPYDSRYDTAAKLFRALRKSDALVAAHHTGYKLDCHVPGTDWAYFDEELQPVLEICSVHGSSEKPDSERPLNSPGEGTFFQDALDLGIHIGAIGGSDSHSGRPVSSPREPRPYPGGMACVYAGELTREGVFEALRSRRCYGTTGAKMIVEFTINGSLMGSIVKAKQKRRIAAVVAGTDKIETLEVIKNNRLLFSASPGKDSCEATWTDTSQSGIREDFYYLKVTQADGEMAWTSPVWVRSGGKDDQSLHRSRA